MTGQTDSTNFEAGTLPEYVSVVAVSHHGCSTRLFDEIQDGIKRGIVHHLPPDGLQKPAQVDLCSDSNRLRKPRKPGIATLIKRAEKTGKAVTSITTSDGTTIHFSEGETEAHAAAVKEWDDAVIPIAGRTKR